MFDRYLNLPVLFLFFFSFCNNTTTLNDLKPHYEILRGFFSKRKWDITYETRLLLCYIYHGTVKRRRKEITETCTQKRNCFFYFLIETFKNVDAAKKQSFRPFAITSRVKILYKNIIPREDLNRVTVGEEKLVISYFVGFCLFFPTVNTENPTVKEFSPTTFEPIACKAHGRY